MNDPAPRHETPPTGGASRHDVVKGDRIARPPDEEVVYRVDEDDPVVGARRRRRFDPLAALAGALAALGTLALLSSLVGAAIDGIGYQTDIDGDDLSIGGLVAGLVVLVLACLVGGWVAGRMARHHGGLHGLAAVVLLVLLAAVIALLAALFGDDLDVTRQIGLPSWFDGDAFTVGAIVTGLVALALALGAGFLGGKLGERHHREHEATVNLVRARRGVREHRGGIVREGRR